MAVSKEDLDREIENLQSTLKKTAVKIKAWVQDDYNQLAINELQQQDDLIKKTNEEKEKIKRRMNNKQVENNKAVEEKLSDIQKLRAELERQYKLTEDLKGKNNKFEAEVCGFKNDVQKLEQEIESMTDDKQKLQYLNKANAIFSDMLGLCLQKTRGNKIQVIFTQIDDKDPQLMFYFFLQVINGKYIVTDSEPQIKGLEELVTRLNETNNLQQFFIRVRRKYKDLAKP